ncbi:GNAT family N-acetyltransferase [Streptomyces ficellus]|uniref:GNAT family N-acetyltransferase n=1 Tax=Streptomyces ficellus TaxID=1977088 RepID=A0ABT7ZBT0_9ACTN|nr:GNAT family N-acetyltransferase [Streptomyces ficellus]MDN3296973.1 GNAT family N-acetyltransferase [Streptomyces ficellus]
MDITIRAVRPEEHGTLGEVTAQAYLGDGLLDFGESDEYLIELRDVTRRAAEAEVLVAVGEDERVVGGVTFVTGGGPWAELARDGEAELRMLAVAPEARGRGAGEALVRACVERARAADGCARLVLSARQSMGAAHRIYERLGFVRTPERDWRPVPGVTLRTYALEC